MEQFQFVPASVYNIENSLNTQTVTKQEFPQYQAEQNTTYHIDSLRNDLFKKLFSEANSLIKKVLSCHRIKHTNLLILKMNDVETEVLKSDFTQQLRCTEAVVQVFTSLYLTLLAWSYRKLSVKRCKSYTHRVMLLINLCTI